MAAFLVFNVFRTEDATARPHGLYSCSAWRGVGYGLIDVLLLTVFPLIVALRLLHDHVVRAERKAAAHRGRRCRW